MTEQEFFKQAIASGKPKSEIEKVYNNIMADKGFDIDSTTAITPQPEPQKTGLGQDIMSSLRGTEQVITSKIERIDKPTVLGSNIRAKIPGYVGEALGKIADVPERTVRTIGTGFGIAGETAAIPINIAGTAIDKATGGRASKALQGALSKVADTKVAQDLMKWYGGLSEAEKANYSTAVDLLEAFSYGAGSAAGKTVGKAVGETAGKVIKSPLRKADDIAGKIAEWATGVDEKALRMGGTKKGRDTLKKAFGKQAEIGQELVDVIDDAYNYMPNKQIIDDALSKTPAINVVPMIKKLEKASGQPTTKEMKAVAAKLKGKAQELRKLASDSGNSGFVNSKKMLEYRREIDTIIDDAFGKESGKFATTLKGLRKDIKEEIVKNAKGTEYEATMKELATKLDALDRIKQLVGKTADSRELKAESFIRNINNKGKTKAKEWLKDFENVFGGEFVEKSEIARLAEMMGEGGSGSWLPRWTTGRSLWAQGAGLTVGSPKIASRLTLPTTRKMANIGEAVSDATKTGLTAYGSTLGMAPIPIIQGKAKNPYGKRK